MPNEVAESVSKAPSAVGRSGRDSRRRHDCPQYLRWLIRPPLFVPAQPGGSCGPACYVDAALAGFPSVKADATSEAAA